MRDPVLSVSTLSRHFGRTTALASVSLSVARGVVHGLVGANGAGKTTLIKHVHGLLRLLQLDAHHLPRHRQSENRLIEGPILHATPPRRLRSRRSYPTHTIH